MTGQVQYHPTYFAGHVRQEAHYGNRIVAALPDRDRSVGELLIRIAAERPLQEAVVDQDMRLSYADLLTAANNVAAELTSHGICAGERVALLIGNSSSFLAAFYGIQLIGAVAVPLNVREQEPEIKHVLLDCSASAIIHDEHLCDRLPRTQDVPDIRAILTASSAQSRSSTGPLPELSKLASSSDEDGVSAIVYTSGTTGQPKGVMLSHFALLSAGIQYKLAFSLTPTDRVLVSVPLTHVTGLTGCMLAALAAGSTLIIMREFKAARFLELAATERMTATIMVPAMYKLCLISGLLQDVDLQAWRIGAFGGAPMTPAMVLELRTSVPGIALFNCYGATETGGAVTLMSPDEIAGREDSVGRATPISEVLVMDDCGRQLTAGEPGELWVKSSTNGIGYWNNADATAKEFIAGFWRTGDIATKDNEGFIRLVDRKKAIINRGGYKIATLEVENLINSIEGVVESAVFGTACPVLGERVRAIVVTESDSITLSDIIDLCKSHLSDFKVPEQIVLTRTALPRNANGKVLKRDLV